MKNLIFVLFLLFLVSAGRAFGIDFSPRYLECRRSLLVRALVVVPQITEERFEKLYLDAMYKGADGNSMAVHDAIYNIAYRVSSKYFVYSPNYLDWIHSLLVFSQSKESLVQPAVWDVKQALKNYVKAQAWLQANDPEWDNAGVCRAAQIGVRYFRARGEDWFVERFINIAKQNECP